MLKGPISLRHPTGRRATRLVIVADDLTGAADSVVCMAEKGTASIVLDRDGGWPADDIVAVDIDSRHCPPDEAAERAAAAAERAALLGARVYKKIDSTLRGNIAVELRAMTDALDRRGSRALVVVAAAFPATGRTTSGGVVHVNGSPLAGPGGGSLVNLLRSGGLRARGVGLERMTDPEALASVLDHEHAAGRDAVVVDSETEEHLSLVVAAAGLAGCPLLLAGSGGLARPLAAAMDGPEPSVGPPTADRAGRLRDSPELVVVGSYTAESRAQTRRLVEHGVRHVVLSDREHDVVARVRDALLTGPVVLSPDPDARVVPSQAPQVARRLAVAAAAALDRAGTLVVTGGETARAVLTAAGVGRLVVLGEVAAGVVRSRVPRLGLDVVTKAGAFGDPDMLLRCLSASANPKDEGVKP